MLTPKDKPAILKFVGIQCSNSNTLDITCNRHENCSCQVVISRTCGDTMFEGYLHVTNERSTVVVECYACVKEVREPQF